MNRNIVLQDIVNGNNYNVTLPCVIGRGKDAGLSFEDQTMSHRHALVSETDNQIYIEDLKSANGVFVNNIRIRDKSPLTRGDSIQLGQTKLVLLENKEGVPEQMVLHSLGREKELHLADHQRLNTIYELATELAGNQEITVLGEKTFSRLKEIFKQDRGYLALFGEDGALKPIFIDSPTGSVPLSSSIINRIFQNGESLLLEDALSDYSFKEQESIMALRIRCAICVPLIFHNRIHGLIYLDRDVPGAYNREDLEFLRGIASLLAPLIENARLWSELKKHYENAMVILKKTEARLIDAERTAAYVRLAQAMAHEIRNPLMVIGGLARKMAKPEADALKNDSFSAITASVERVEMVLREVDNFAKIPLPQIKLHRIDNLLQEEIQRHDEEWRQKGLRPSLSVSAARLMVPVDNELMRKAVSMVFKEIIFALPQGSDFGISIQDSGSGLEIVFGESSIDQCSCELFDPELQGKMWSRSLFLNIAHKIITDHGGKMLFDPSAYSAFPVIIRILATREI
ncbi:MAG: FHA domain-containing protein [Nitrospirae bacterium]|nr:FHA domain-containing protein [Nitrospirota bacterium]